MSNGIELHQFVSPYKPIVSVLSSWDAAQQATWPATSVSLLSGEREAVLIDALITRAEAERVVDWVRATGKRLTTVYITVMEIISSAWIRFSQRFPKPRPLRSRRSCRCPGGRQSSIWSFGTRCSRTRSRKIRECPSLCETA